MKKRRLIIVFIIIAFLFLILPFKVSNNIRNYSWKLTEPIGIFFNYSFGNTISYFKSIFHLKNIIKQNSDLVNENLQLQSQISELSEIKNENEVLKKELGFMQTQDLTKTISSAVIGRSNEYLKSLIIDKGSINGISKGDAVISQGILIGIISNVRQNNSDVLLVTDYSSIVPVMLQESHGTGLLKGGFQGLIVEDIPLNISIKEKENIITSGLGGQIPQGILIGSVSGIVSKEGEIFQKVTTSSLIDFSNLKVVFIIKNVI